MGSPQSLIKNPRGAFFSRIFGSILWNPFVDSRMLSHTTEVILSFLITDSIKPCNSFFLQSVNNYLVIWISTYVVNWTVIWEVVGHWKKSAIFQHEDFIQAPERISAIRAFNSSNWPLVFCIRWMIHLYMGTSINLTMTRKPGKWRGMCWIAVSVPSIEKGTRESSQVGEGGARPQALMACSQVTAGVRDNLQQSQRVPEVTGRTDDTAHFWN